jgi:hypothetical protein
MCKTKHETVRLVQHVLLPCIYVRLSVRMRLHCDSGGNNQHEVLKDLHVFSPREYENVFLRCFENVAQFRYFGMTITNQNPIQE